MAGRPRSFDPAEVLEIAMRLFWEKGFDAVSVAELSGATGLGAPSLYAAFGDKRALFELAVERYTRGLDAALERDLATPTARGSVENLLASAAEHFSRTDQPPGCLVMSQPELAARRDLTRTVLRGRLELAQVEGELSSDQVEDMAALIDSVLAGMAARARDGADHRELERVVRATMTAWPATPSCRSDDVNSDGTDPTADSAIDGGATETVHPGGT